MKFLSIFFLIFFSQQGERLIELTQEDIFSSEPVSSPQVSFFGVKIGDPLSLGREKIPGFKTINEGARQAVFENAYVEYDEKERITAIAIGKGYRDRMVGKVKDLFSDSIFEDNEKRYIIIKPASESIKVKEITIDKIKIEQYEFNYPDRGFSLIGRKDDKGFHFLYFIIKKKD